MHEKESLRVKIYIDLSHCIGYYIKYHNTLFAWYKLNRPSTIYRDGAKYWYKNNNYHSIGGPAKITSNGDKHYYINGKHIKTVKYD